MSLPMVKLRGLFWKRAALPVGAATALVLLTFLAIAGAGATFFPEA